MLHLSFSLLRSHRRHDPHQVLLFLCWNVLILFSSTLGYSHSRRRGCRRVIKSAWWNNKKKRGGTAIRRADDLRIVEMLLVILCAVGSRQQQLCVTHYTFRKATEYFSTVENLIKSPAVVFSVQRTLQVGTRFIENYVALFRLLGYWINTALLYVGWNANAEMMSLSFLTPQDKSGFARHKMSFPLPTARQATHLIDLFDDSRCFTNSRQSFERITIKRICYQKWLCVCVCSVMYRFEKTLRPITCWTLCQTIFL